MITSCLMIKTCIAAAAAALWASKLPQQPLPPPLLLLLLLLTLSYTATCAVRWLQRCSLTHADFTRVQRIVIFFCFYCFCCCCCCFHMCSALRWLPRCSLIKHSELTHH
jgi:hypothetical protein